MHNRGPVLICVEEPLQTFIEKQYHRQASEWHDDRHDFYNDLKKWKAMNFDQILEKFDDFVDKRNAQLMTGKKKRQYA